MRFFQEIYVVLFLMNCFQFKILFSVQKQQNSKTKQFFFLKLPISQKINAPCNFKNQPSRMGPHQPSFDLPPSQKIPSTTRLAKRPRQILAASIPVTMQKPRKIEWHNFREWSQKKWTVNRRSSSWRCWRETGGLWWNQPKLYTQMDGIDRLFECEGFHRDNQK